MKPTQTPAVATHTPTAGLDRASGIREPGFFQSEYDGSWWLAFADDRPNKLIGHESNLPDHIRAVLQSAKE